MAKRKSARKTSTAGASDLPPLRFQPRLEVPLLAAIAIAVAVVLAPACRGKFLGWDDQQTVAKNPWIRPGSGESFTHFWAHSRMDLYIPVTYDVWAVVAAGAEQQGIAGDLDPQPFHIGNLTLHVLATLFVYAILRGRVGVGPWPAAAGAVLFGMHPIQVEAVAWISGLKDVLYATLCLAAICVDPLAGAAEGNMIWGKGTGRYATATALFVLALLSKPTAIVLPGIVLLLAWGGGRGRWSRAALVRMAPWFALALACAAWTKAVQAVATQPAPLWFRPIVAGHALGTYLGKLLLPVKLAVDYGYSPRWLQGHRLAWAVALVPLAAAAARGMLWRRARWVAVGGMICLLALLPVLGLVPFDFQFYSTVADHYLYLPMLGVAVVVAWGASKLRPPPAQVTAAVMLALVLGARSWVQAAYWRDDATLFGRTLEVNPDSIAALDTLGTVALRERRPQEAEALARHALRVRPDYPTAWVGLAAAYSAQGRGDEAIDAYRTALKLAPNDPEVLVNFAIALAQQGQLDPAEQMLKHALRMNPQDARAHLNLGTVYEQWDMKHAGWSRLVEAQREFEWAVKLDPADPQGHSNLGIVLEERGIVDQAREEFRAALRVQPGYPPAVQGMQRLGTAR